MDFEKIAANVSGKFIKSGCEKLPEGAMRDNCEKKKKDNGDKKEAAKGEVPEAFKKEWKNNDKDNDGKENEPKPEFLKDKKSSIAERVAGKMVEARRSSSIKEFIRDNEDEMGQYGTEAKMKLMGPNTDTNWLDVDLNDLRAMAQHVYASRRTAGCEKLPEGPMRDNCEKKKKDNKKEAAVDLNQLDEDIVDALHRAGIGLNSIKKITPWINRVLIQIDEQPLTAQNLKALERAGLKAVMANSIAFDR